MFGDRMFLNPFVFEGAPEGLKESGLARPR
jgi:hypothetical protein